MRILVVEDEVKVLNFIRKGLQENAYTVDTASDGEEGLFLAEENEYDCIVLDIMLPKVDGYQIIRTLRSKRIKTPVIFLTAKDTVSDRVKGLDYGADDYLVKPFAFAELLARIKALVRREKDKPQDVLGVADLTMNLLQHKVQRGTTVVELTPKEFALLRYFMEHCGQVLTRTMISENVWGYNFDSMTNVIDVHINSLREKIDKGFDQKLIHTVRGVGYVFEQR
ncbi:MAG: heavy metal response regulator transcription factor [Candidatus Omnitrophica bacterium]|nr:heavy metal response regulator transcription factor [Candidatus Omnitrophota bacterium]